MKGSVSVYFAAKMPSTAWLELFVPPVRSWAETK